MAFLFYFFELLSNFSKQHTHSVVSLKSHNEKTLSACLVTQIIAVILSVYIHTCLSIYLHDIYTHIRLWWIFGQQFLSNISSLLYKLNFLLFVFPFQRLTEKALRLNTVLIIPRLLHFILYVVRSCPWLWKKSVIGEDGVTVSFVVEEAIQRLA